MALPRGSAHPRLRRARIWMLPWRSVRRQAVAHDPEKWVPVFGKDHAPTNRSAPYETDDVFDYLHRFRRHHLGARGAVGEHRVDMAGIGGKPLHLGGNRPELCDRKVDQRRLERGELRAGKFLERLLL